MGLDQTLNREHYIGGQYSHREVEGKFKVKLKPYSSSGLKKVKIPVNRIVSVTEHVMEWRKANAIHGWFVREVQGGEDDCGRYAVSPAQLQELCSLCQLAVKTKDPSLLPPTSGFFFGSTETNEWYWKDLKATIKVLEPVLKEIAVEKSYDTVYYYSSSW